MATHDPDRAQRISDDWRMTHNNVFSVPPENMTAVCGEGDIGAQSQNLSRIFVGRNKDIFSHDNKHKGGNLK